MCKKHLIKCKYNTNMNDIGALLIDTSYFPVLTPKPQNPQKSGAQPRASLASPQAYTSIPAVSSEFLSPTCGREALLAGFLVNAQSGDVSC
jgi:hypothetical protein